VLTDLSGWSQPLCDDPEEPRHLELARLMGVRVIRASSNHEHLATCAVELPTNNAHCSLGRLENTGPTLNPKRSAQIRCTIMHQTHNKKT
jgi:hypothetical protein